MLANIDEPPYDTNISGRPVTGLPLMFVSYGGSSMFANMMAIGLLQNVHMRSHD